MTFLWEAVGCPSLDPVFRICAEDRGTHGTQTLVPQDHCQPPASPSIMAPKAPGIPLDGDLNVIAPSWMGDESVSLQLLLWL